jgi:murein DD-endopeptidase MepM/ murein hydrolase activator NlpD
MVVTRRRKRGTRPPSWRGWTLRAGWLLPLAVVALITLLPDVSARVTAHSLLLAPPQFDPAQVRTPGLELTTEASLPLEGKLDRGGSLGGMLAELGLDARDRQLVSAALAEHVELRRLRPGVHGSAVLAGQARPARLQLVVPGKGRLHLAALDEGWDSHWEPSVERVALRRVEAEVRSSMAEALATAGAPVEVAYAIAEVLRWDVDFGRDLRGGDRLQVLFEEIRIDDLPARVGNVLAIGLTNRGRLIEAYNYADGGYYDADGHPLRKLFLRSPLAFSTRITSHFTHRRFHPVLKSWRPHYGVDYGAPVGTPVRVTADGVVLSVGWDGGGGKTVKVRHPGGYMTAYLHLSGYAAGLGRGDRVRQGEVVGFVGSTGLSTAPHLDYRVQLSGRWIDPLSLKAVPAPPLSRQEMPAFTAWRDQLRLALETGVVPGADLPQWQLASSPPSTALAPSAVGGR